MLYGFSHTIFNDIALNESHEARQADKAPTLGADGVVDLVIVEEGLGAVTPWEGLLADVVVLVEGALGGLVAVLVVFVNHVVVVVLLNPVDVHAKHNRARNAHVQRNLAPQISGLCWSVRKDKEERRQSVCELQSDHII